MDAGGYAKIMFDILTIAMKSIGAATFVIKGNAGETATSGPVSTANPSVSGIWILSPEK